MCVWHQGLDDTRTKGTTGNRQLTDSPLLTDTFRLSWIQVNGRLCLLADVAPLVLPIRTSNQRLSGAGQGSPQESRSRHARRHASKQVWLSQTIHIFIHTWIPAQMCAFEKFLYSYFKTLRSHIFRFLNVRRNGNPCTISHLLIWIIANSFSPSEWVLHWLN